MSTPVHDLALCSFPTTHDPDFPSPRSRWGIIQSEFFPAQLACDRRVFRNVTRVHPTQDKRKV